MKVCRKCKKNKDNSKYGHNRKRFRRSLICDECHKSRSFKVRLALKKEFVKAYGGKCQCCGESKLAFMTLDHINHDGKKHREQLRSRGEISGNGLGNRMYRWLKKNGWPKRRFRLLCMNCNHATMHRTPCPHNNKIYEKWLRKKCGEK